MNNDDPYISTTLAAQMVCVPARSIARWCKTGLVDGHKIMGRWQVSKDSLLEFIRTEIDNYLEEN